MVEQRIAAGEPPYVQSLVDLGANIDAEIINRNCTVWYQNYCWWFLHGRYWNGTNYYGIDNRRKFRSETSNNMDRWKAELGRGREKRRVEERRSKNQRRERVRRKQMQMREKVGKSRNTVFFQWFVAPKGRKVGSLKRRVRSQLARWEIKNCTPMWREANFQVKRYKTPAPRSTFGSWDVQKKIARHCGAKHISKSKCTKHTILGQLLDIQSSFRVAGARDCGPCQKWAKRVVLQHFHKRWQAWDIARGSAKMHFPWQDAVQKTCSWEMLGGQGADFLRGVAFWSIRSVGLLRWFCVTGAALRMTWHQFFVAGAVL